MMKRMVATIACVAIGLLLALGLPVVAQTGSPSSAPSNSAPSNSGASTQASVDRQFVITAAEAGAANIAMGQLALQRSDNQQVKQFAQAEINEQQQVKQDLTRIAPSLGVQLPTTPSPKYQALLARLSQLSGNQFNQAYLHEGGVNAHLENAATFQREAQFGQNQDLVGVANKGLPIIQQHFSTASSLTSYRFGQVSQRFNGSANTQGSTTPVVVPAPAR